MDPESQAPSGSWMGQVGRLAAVVAIVAATLAVIAYGVVAVRWRAQPFPGAILATDLTVEGIYSVRTTSWEAYQAGLRPGDRLTAVGDVEFAGSTSALQEQLRQALDGMEPGVQFEVAFERPIGDGSATTRGLACLDAESEAQVSRCTAPILLSTFPWIDLLAQFGSSMVSALALLAAGVILLRIRWDKASTHLVPVLSASLAVVSAGIFDSYTSRAFSSTLLPAALVLTGGVLSHMALDFPFALLPAQRMRWLNLVPVLVTGILLVAIAGFVVSPDVVAPGLLLLAASLFAVAAAIVFLGLLVYRLRWTVSPVIRDQCAITTVGGLLAFAPLFVWFISRLLQGAFPTVPLGFAPGLVTPFFVVFLAGLAVAVALDRLPRTVNLLNQGLVYGVMVVGITIGYGLLVTGFTLLFGSSIEASNPLVIALTVFLIALLFIPVRNALERSISTSYFRSQRLYQQHVEMLAQDLTKVSTLAGIVQAIRSHLNEMLAPTHLFLFFPDLDGNTYGAHGVPEPETDVRFSARSALLRLLERQQRVLYLAPDEPLPVELAPERSRLAVLGAPVYVPLQGRERLSGILVVGPRQTAARYRYDDLQFMQSIADQAALAVERAQVIGRLEQRVREMNVLGQVAQAVNFTVEFEDLLELIYAQTNRLINAPNFFIALRDPNADEMYYAFYTEDHERIVERENMRWRLGRDLMSDVVRGGQPMRVENYAAETARRGGQLWLDNPNMKAWMGVPLSAPGIALGVMSVGSTSPGVVYTDEQLKLLWLIADQAATAIDKARLFRETQVRARQLTALNQISTQLATVFQDPARLLELITESAVNILEAEAGSLLMINEQTNELEFKVAIGNEAEDLVGTKLPPGTGLVGTVADRGEPVIVNDTTRDPRWYSGVDQDIEFRTATLMAAPLIISGGVIGVLEVINKIDGGVFVDDDKHLLTTFAGQAAIAIENARLFQMTDRQLAARVDELDMMQRIDRELNRTLDLKRVLDITLNWALRESHADAGMVGMVVKDPAGLQIVTHYGYPPAVVERFNEGVPLVQGISGRVVRTGNSEIVSDVKLDSDYSESLPNCRSQMTVPLITGGEVSGVILLENMRENAFSLLALDFVSRLAEHASPAMANATLFSQLGHANEARSEFVGVVAHELKTPMTSIQGYADLLVGGAVGPLNDQQRHFLGTIRSNVDRMNTLVSDLNDVTKLQTNRMHMEFTQVDFQHALSEALRSLEQQMKDKRQALSLKVPAALPMIYADENRLVQVLTNLVSNAHKYSPDGSDLTIVAEATRNIWSADGPSEVLHFYVRDNGLGISEEDRLELFTPYFRSNNPVAQDQPGTGLGLVIVRGIVEQHNGRIWLQSKLGEGSTFHVTLPLASAVQKV